MIVDISKGVYVLNEISRAQPQSLPMSLTTHVTNPPLHSCVYLQALSYFRDTKMKTIKKVDMQITGPLWHSSIREIGNMEVTMF